MAVNFSESKTKENLMRAFAGESQARSRYTASAFYQIAEVEHVHEERFGRLAKLLEDGTYYGGGEVKKWMCTNCGYIHEGNQAPKYCPACRHEQGYFIPYEFACYRGE